MRRTSRRLAQLLRITAKDLPVLLFMVAVVLAIVNLAMYQLAVEACRATGRQASWPAHIPHDEPDAGEPAGGQALRSSPVVWHGR